MRSWTAPPLLLLDQSAKSLRQPQPSFSGCCTLPLVIHHFTPLQPRFDCTLSTDDTSARSHLSLRIHVFRIPNTQQQWAQVLPAAFRMCMWRPSFPYHHHPDGQHQASPTPAVSSTTTSSFAASTFNRQTMDNLPMDSTLTG